MKTRTLTLSFLTLAALALAAVWIADAFAPPPSAFTMRPDDPATLALGEKIYRQHEPR